MSFYVKQNTADGPIFTKFSKQNHHNPTDALTKFKGAHVEPLMKLMRTGKWQLRPEAEVLGEMQIVRSELGYTPRPKKGWSDDEIDDEY